MLIAGRALERVLIVLGGFLCLWLGYRLFFLVARESLSVKTVEGKAAGIRFKAEGVAPGIFFAAFGCLVLGYAMQTRVELSIKDVVSAVDASKASSSATPSVAMASSTPAWSREIDVVMLTPAGSDSSINAFHAVNTLINLRQVASSSGAASLESRQFDKFMAASRFLTLYQRAYIESKFGPGTYDNSVTCGRSPMTPTCVQARADPTTRKAMDAVLKELSEEVQ